MLFLGVSATNQIYTLSLHDALPISRHETHVEADLLPAPGQQPPGEGGIGAAGPRIGAAGPKAPQRERQQQGGTQHAPAERPRSEEHTSELQSHVNLVCRLLLEKKNI